MRKIFATALLLAVFFVGTAQQLHFTSQYLQHNSMYNPAAAGISNNNLLGLSYRSQWASFPGHPRTMIAYGDFNMPKMNAGLAGYLYRDETGPTSRNGIQLAYSYHVRSKNEKSKLGLGIELRALQFAINKSKLTDALGSDPLLNGSSSKIGIDAGAGVYWTNDKLSVGIAASQLIQSKLTFAEGASNIKESGRLYRHYNVTANYKIQTGDDIYLIPNAMARFIQNSPSEFDFGVNLDYKEKFWAGLNWRMNQFWSLQAGVKVLQKIKLTYSYDIYENPINVFSGGSEAHEIGLQFSLKK